MKPGRGRRSRALLDPDFDLGWKGPLCGIDEVGRGPLAGPVVAAAVRLPLGGLPAELLPLVHDSKVLTVRAREVAFEAIMGQLDHGIGRASVAEIDRLNIRQASRLAMQRAFFQLQGRAHREGPLVTALIDGNDPPELPCSAIPIIGGDGRSCAIAAASILAKVTRDRIMTALAVEHPAYGWDSNAGYATAAHIAAIKIWGVTPHHRTSFGIVRELLATPD